MVQVDKHIERDDKDEDSLIVTSTDKKLTIKFGYLDQNNVI